jgi:glycosyltransferase involved in cell wall biosynthesis
MKILYSHYLQRDDHVAAAMVSSVAAGLGALGHEVRVHRSAGPAPEAPDAPRSPGRGLVAAAKGRLWFAKALARNLGMFRRDRRAIRDFRPDVVLARQDAYCLSMAWATRRSGTRLVTYADAPVAYESRLFPAPGRWHPPALVEAAERWVLRQSRAAVTISNPSARRLEAHGTGVPVHVVPNGIDPAHFPAFGPTEKAELRGRFGVTGKRTVGFVGSFRPFHGLDRLRELILATAGDPDLQWLLVGDGPGRAELERAVAGRSRAAFFGRQPAAALPGLMALMDVSVATHANVAGDFYFCPLKILEYAASSSAVVASDQGDIPTLLPHGCAVIVGEDSTPAWAGAIRGLLDDPARVASLGRAARSHVFAELTWARTAERVERVLQGVMKESMRCRRQP